MSCAPLHFNSIYRLLVLSAFDNGRSDLQTKMQNLQLLVASVIQTLVSFSKGEGYC